eukprot:ctg_1238.g284
MQRASSTNTNAGVA